MSYCVVPIAEEHIAGFNSAVDSVAREHAYLAFLEGPPLETSREFVRRNIRENRPHFVALYGGRVVGWCDISSLDRPVFSHAGLLGMGIVSEHRGKGLGRRLIDRAIAKAREIGLERIVLTVREKNTRAIALYEKVGFVIEGRHPRAVKVDEQYESHLTMGLWLGGV